MVDRRTSSCLLWSRLLRLAVRHDKQLDHDLTKSHNPLAYKSLVRASCPGFYVLTPLLVRSLEKLCKIIDQEMVAVGAQKIVMPSLVSASLWQKSGRWDEMRSEIFRLKDRHDQDFCLAPTHEEVVSQLVANIRPLTENCLPLYLYQITSKFRDEIRTKLGLIRAKEFLMKDLYTFDRNEGDAKATYEKICQSYESLFRKIELPVVKAIGSVGSMGGKYSHEYHLVSEIGEDNLIVCDGCGTTFNEELLRDDACIKCQGQELRRIRGIEVGHAFNLGTRYSDSFDLKYRTRANAFESVEMGCFGLGVTRILSASTCVLSDDQKFRWPLKIAPVKVCFELPKAGSKEEVAAGLFAIDSATIFNHVLDGDFIVDDRTHLTIGKRLEEATAIGIPYVVIAGKRITESVPIFEVLDTYKNEAHFLNHRGVIDYLNGLT